MDEHALECLRKAGAIFREARELGVGLVDEGKRLVDVANEVEAFIVHRGARPAFPVNIGVNDIAAISLLPPMTRRSSIAAIW